jgi:hypothetical protein
MEQQLSTFEREACQGGAPANQRSPSYREWFQARLALRVVAKRKLHETVWSDVGECASALERVSAYIAGQGYGLPAYACLATACAVRGRFFTRDAPRVAQIALDGFRFFDTGRTASAPLEPGCSEGAAQ